MTSFDYSFLDPDTDGFVYSNGCISIRKPLGMDIFTAGIANALGRILDRLREETYFGNVYHSAMHRIRVLIHYRRTEFDKFRMTPHLEKVFRM